MLGNGVATGLPQDHGYFLAAELHRHRVTQGAVVVVRFACPVSDAGYKYGKAGGHIDEGQRYPSPENTRLGVHPGAGHAWHRVVVGDHAVMH
ncbi:hypothetical protein D3C84_1075790 [compost metagenome]